MIFDDSKMLI